MEFPSVGKHCSEPYCKQLDFLPFKCAGCDKIFCLEHRSYDSHHCPKRLVVDRKAIVCPICNIPIPVPPGEDPNTRIDDHINSGCATTVRSTPRYPCSVRGCKNVELAPLMCNKCGRHHCVTHRFEDHHKCTGRHAPKKQPIAHPNPPATTPAPVPSSASYPGSASTTPVQTPSTPMTTIRVKLPNAQTIQNSFPATSSFSEIISFIESHREPDMHPYTLRTTYPQRVFSAADQHAPLDQLGLVPSAMILMETHHNPPPPQPSGSEGGLWQGIKSYLGW
eukprot:TRINITY_DN7311_c0_g1_i4.p1 TRINITY_DN7311_c0_g1~~TRINITY_DN7311_c0_g1_i4.p1  ORF type:complete len:293 (-),score=42.83 TRINITY_DN7311_c0_g1_i4:68-904(-)